jgi:hypothetical protein
MKQQPEDAKTSACAVAVDRNYTCVCVLCVLMYNRMLDMKSCEAPCSDEGEE